MGGQDQQPQYPVVYHDAQQPQQPPVQQQQLYFQPAPQYLPQVAHYNNVQADIPVLQGSSNPIYPQAQPVYPQVPQQPIYPTVQPVEQQQAPRCRFSCERFKTAIRELDAYRVGAFATVFSTLAYFLFTPHAWPWFLLIAAISAGICGSKLIKAKFDMSERKPHLYVHGLWYTAFNIFFVLTNLWSAGYPWAVFPLCLWGAGVALHALRIHNANLTTMKSRLYVHFIVYVAVVIIILVTCSRGYRAKPLIPLIVIAVWSILLTLHARRVRKLEERQSDVPPAELEVVSSIAQVPNQTNEADNAQLVQNQQEVYNSIHQAQQEQRAQQPQVHLFQQPTANIYPASN